MEKMNQVEFAINLVGMLHEASLIGYKFIICSVNGLNAEVKFIDGEGSDYCKKKWEGYKRFAQQGRGELYEYCTFRG